MRNGNLWSYLNGQGAQAGLSGPLPIANYDGTPIPCTGPSAFTLPPANAGRFGDASVGSRSRTDAVSLSLIKSVKTTEQLQFQFGAQAANALNHRNFEVPNMEVDQPGFGTISALQTAEGAGPRNAETTVKVSF